LVIAVDGAQAVLGSSVTIDRMHLLWEKLGLDLGAVSMHDRTELRSNYGLHCQRLRLSVPDSEIVADVGLHLLTAMRFFRGVSLELRIRLSDGSAASQV
jgi:hypothetical protein